MTQTVGKVYAEALFLLAQEEHRAKGLYEELNAAADLMAAHPELLTLLSVPTLSVGERLSVLREVIGEDEGTIDNFLCLLVERHRISRIAEIRDAYNQMYYEAYGIAEVSVTTAEPLNDAQRARLTKQMEQKLGRRILLHEQCDPAILGGMIVQYGDTRMDNSLRTRMREMSANLRQK